MLMPTAPVTAEQAASKAVVEKAKAAIRRFARTKPGDGFDCHNPDHIEAYLLLKAQGVYATAAQLRDILRPQEAEKMAGVEIATKFWLVAKTNFPNGLSPAIARKACTEACSNATHIHEPRRDAPI